MLAPNPTREQRPAVNLIPFWSEEGRHWWAFVLLDAGALVPVSVFSIHPTEEEAIESLVKNAKIATQECRDTVPAVWSVQLHVQPDSQEA